MSARRREFGEELGTLSFFDILAGFASEPELLLLCSMRADLPLLKQPRTQIALVRIQPRLCSCQISFMKNLPTTVESFTRTRWHCCRLYYSHPLDVRHSTVYRASFRGARRVFLKLASCYHKIVGPNPNQQAT